MTVAVPYLEYHDYLHDSYGAGVTEKHLDGGRGHRGKVKGAQLAHEGQVNIHIAGLSKLTSGLRVDADQLGTLRL